MADFDCVDYVITHKPHPVQVDDMYRKLCVGGYYDDISASETEGKNIAEYNDRLNELTGLYWMWKNTDSAYIGLSHYRRFFDNGGRLDKATAGWILTDGGYDIILSQKTAIPWSLEYHINKRCGGFFSQAVKESIIRAMEKHQPDYVETFRSVLAGKWMYICNMFVTRREIMNQYCEWLFSFILEAADSVDVSQATATEKRTAGFDGEILLTVWMEKHPEMKIYDMPIMMT